MSTSKTFASVAAGFEEVSKCNDEIVDVMNDRDARDEEDKSKDKEGDPKVHNNLVLKKESFECQHPELQQCLYSIFYTYGKQLDVQK